LGDFGGHRSLVSTDGGDVTKATKHEGNWPDSQPLVAPATNVNITNFATGDISDTLQSLDSGKAPRDSFSDNPNLHQQATESRLRIDAGMECSKRRQARTEEARLGNAAGTNAGKERLRRLA
jgi:hypothetical protein